MTLESILVQIPQYLKRWTDYPSFDDMVAVARLWAWRAWEATHGLPPKRRASLIFKVVGQQVSKWLGSPANPYRKFNRRYRAIRIVEVPLTIVEKIEEGRLKAPTWWKGSEPDFVPALLERIVAEEEIDRLSKNEEERTILRKLILEEWSESEIAKGLGKSREVVAWRKRELRSRSATYRSNRSKFGGIFLQVRGRYRNYRVMARIDGTQVYFGSYQDPEEAKIVLDSVRLVYGEGKAPLELLPDSLREEKSA